MAFHSPITGPAAWKRGMVTVDVECLCCKAKIRKGSLIHYCGRKHEGARWEGMKDLRSFLCDLCWEEYSVGTLPVSNLKRFRKEKT